MDLSTLAYDAVSGKMTLSPEQWRALVKHELEWTSAWSAAVKCGRP